MVPIIPAIPRSLEKRRLKGDVKDSEVEGGIGSPIRPTSPTRNEESQVETAVAQAQAVPNGALNGSNEKEDVQDNVVQENVVQEAINETTEDGVLKKDVAGGKSTFQSTIVPKADNLRIRWQHRPHASPCARLRNRETWISSTSPLLSEAVSTTSHLDRCFLRE